MDKKPLPGLLEGVFCLKDALYIRQYSPSDLSEHSSEE